MSVQTGLRDLGRNNASDWRGIALKKGAAPPVHRTAAKPTAAAVHATFISPPRNTPIMPMDTAGGNSGSRESYSNAPMGLMSNSRAGENESIMTRPAAYHPRMGRTDFSLTSADLEASFPSGGSDVLPYPSAVVGSGLRSVSDVPVLSMGCEEEPRRNITAVEAMASLAGARSERVSPAPVSQPMATTTAAVPTAVFVPGATPEEEIVAAFLTSCVGRVVEAACTPQGKALLVAALETERDEVLEPVTAEICDGLREIAVDPHGCHVLRTLVEACTPEQTEALIASMYPSVVLNICTTSQHTRLTLQSLFERRLVELWPVVDVLAANAGYLAATQQGCISLMRVFERCDVEQKAALVQELLPKFAALSMDAFANYMVQCAIEHSDRTTAAQYVVQHFSGHLLQMSCDKYASNVVEKVVRVCGGVPAVRRLLLDELIFNPAALKELVSDGYGNFVVQSVVEATTNAMELKRVEDRLRPALVSCPFAAKIEAKLKAKRPGQTHNAGGAHHQPQQLHRQQQQQQRRTSYVNTQANNSNSNISVYGIPVGVNVQMHQGMPQRSSSYRMEGQGIVVGAAVANSVTGGNSFRHHPYVPQTVAGAARVNNVDSVQRYHDANAQLRHTPPVQTAAPIRNAEYVKFAGPNGRVGGGCGGAMEAMSTEVEGEDSGPVYGPSPAARRHLEQRQQQPFRPPFNGTL
jgi:hypothetical protein